MKKDIKVIIFDCDGVMFDSKLANIKFYNHILSRFNLPEMPPEQIEYVHMHTADKSIRYIFKGTPYVEEALVYRREMDYTPFIKYLRMEPGLRELLEILKGLYGLAVATNRSNTIGRVLEENNISEYFDVVVSSLDVENPKPHPEPLLRILEYFKIGPEHAFYVGDSEVDMETAKKARIPFIAYKNKNLHADYYVDSHLDIARDVLEIKE